MRNVGVPAPYKKDNVLVAVIPGKDCYYFWLSKGNGSLKIESQNPQASNILRELHVKKWFEETSYSPLCSCTEDGKQSKSLQISLFSRIRYKEQYFGGSNNVSIIFVKSKCKPSQVQNS